MLYFDTRFNIASKAAQVSYSRPLPRISQPGVRSRRRLAAYWCCYLYAVVKVPMPCCGADVCTVVAYRVRLEYQVADKSDY